MSSKFNSEQWLTMNWAELYEGAEYITTPAAAALIAQALEQSVETAGDRWQILDVGCGMAQVGEEMRKNPAYNKAEPLCTDIDDSQLEAVKGKGFSAQRVDVENMPFENQFTHVFANLVYHIIKDSYQGIAHSIKALQPGGILGFTTWAYSGPYELLSQASSDLPVPPMPQGVPPWARKEYILEQLAKHPELEDMKLEKFHYAHDNGKTDHELAMDMRPVVYLCVKRWPQDQQREYGWEFFGKIEEVLKQWKNLGKEFGSDAWIVTARKKLGIGQ